MKKGKLFIGAVVVLAFCIMFWIIYKSNKTNIVKEIKIGVILPLSGSQSLFGQDSLAAMRIAETEINKNAISEKGRPIKLIVEDGKYSSKDTIMAYNKLKSEDVLALIVFGDVPAFTLAPYIENDKIPCIAHVASGQNVANLSSWMFRGWFSTEQIVKAMLGFMIDEQGSNYSILSINNNAGDEFVNYMLQEASNNGINCLAQDTFEMDSSDVRSQIKKVLKDNINFVAVLGFGPGYVTVMNQLSESGYKENILTDVCIAHRSYKNGIKDKLAKIYYTDCKVLESAEGCNDFLSQYHLKTGEEADLFAIFGYVNVKILSKAFNAAGAESENVKNWLSNMKDYESIIGSLSFDKDGNMEMPLELFKLNFK